MIIGYIYIVPSGQTKRGRQKSRARQAKAEKRGQDEEPDGEVTWDFFIQALFQSSMNIASVSLYYSLNYVLLTLYFKLIATQAIKYN